MNTLGINAVYHDPAACLVQDGRVIAAAEEERFTHVKHGKRPIPFSTYELPFHAIDYCLREAGIALADIDHIAYSYDPFLLLDRHRDEAVITLPLEPSAYPTPDEWESPWDPLFLSSIVNAPKHLVPSENPGISSLALLLHSGSFTDRAGECNSRILVIRAWSIEHLDLDDRAFLPAAFRKHFAYAKPYF